jgi:hypothetical protein
MRYGGTNAKRERMVCRRCEAEYARARRRKIDPLPFRGRYTLRRAPELYVIARYRNCPVCGSSNVRSDESNRRREMIKRLATKKICHVLFPHEHGTLFGCECHAKHPDDWTEDEYRQAEGMLATKRSG